MRPDKRSDAALKKLKVQALDDMWAFGDLIDFRGGMDTFHPLHREMADHVSLPQREVADPLHRRRMFLVPRAYRKSTINTVLYVMWRHYRNPDVRVLIGSGEKQLSGGFLKEMKSYYEDKELQDLVFNARPHIEGRLIPYLSKVDGRKKSNPNMDDDEDGYDAKIVWNVNSIQLVRREKMKEPSVLVCSVNMSITGHHYDLLIYDDIVDFDNSSTLAKAQKIETWAGDLESVLIRKPYKSHITKDWYEYLGNEVVVSGTRYYDYDWYSHYVGNAAATMREGGRDYEDIKNEMHVKAREAGYSLFYCNIYVNGVNNEDGYTLPEEFDDNIVKDLLRDLRSYRRFAAQYLLTVVSSEEQVLHSSDLQMLSNTYKQYGDNIVLVQLSNKERESDRYIRLQMVVDPASTTGKRSNRSCILVGGRDHEKNLILVDYFIGKVIPSKLGELIHEMAAKWKLPGVYIERNAQQSTYASIIRMLFQKYRPLAIHEVYHGEDKDERIENWLEPLLSNGMIYLFYHILKHSPITGQLDLHPHPDNDFIDALAFLAEVTKPTVQRDYEQRKDPRVLVLGSDGIYRAQNDNPTQHIVINTKYGGCR